MYCLYLSIGPSVWHAPYRSCIEMGFMLPYFRDIGEVPGVSVWVDDQQTDRPSDVASIVQSVMVPAAPGVCSIYFILYLIRPNIGPHQGV